MKLFRTIIIVILAIVLSIGGGVLVVSCNDPVSVNCRRACEHVKSTGWIDCVLMCEDVVQ